MCKVLDSGNSIVPSFKKVGHFHYAAGLFDDTNMIWMTFLFVHKGTSHGMDANIEVRYCDQMLSLIPGKEDKFASQMNLKEFCLGLCQLDFWI